MTISLKTLMFLSLTLVVPAMAQEAGERIEVFVREGCPHCTDAKAFLDQLLRERPALKIERRDVGKDDAALARLRELAAEHRIPRVGVPAFFLQGELIVGFTSAETTGRRIRSLLDRAASGPQLQAGSCDLEETTPCAPEPVAPTAALDGIDMPIFGHVTLQEVGLPVFTLLIGLLDGFNPCAMWVLLFLLSLLATLRDRTKMFLIAGTFVLVSGLVYFAFMAAWLNVFLWIGLSRVTQLVLAGIAGMIGAVNIKDFFALGRGPTLAIPTAAKPGIYARTRAILRAENLLGALLGVMVLAFLVNTVELLCTAGFPALYTEILTLHPLSGWQYYGYLTLYILAYIFDDSVMVTLAVVTLSHHKLQAREGRWLKLVSGLVMVGLAAVLVFK
jgi:glutaredoxin